MNHNQYTYLLQHPNKVSATSLNEIQEILQNYPYCQSARALYLKSLKEKESFRYNLELKKTACYTTDRSVLFNFITSEEFNQNKISEAIKKNTAYINQIPVVADDISVHKKVIIDSNLQAQVAQTKGVLDANLFKPKNTNDKLPEQILNLGKPLQFNTNETHSFNEWLQLTSFTPITRKEEETEKDEKSNRLKKFDLIEKFIQKKPKIKPENKTKSNINLAEQNTQPEALMTETLARIYLEQKKFDQAIQSYKILSLKYPEKSGFFADQIKAIKKLQEQNNNLQ